MGENKQFKIWIQCDYIPAGSQPLEDTPGSFMTGDILSG